MDWIQQLNYLDLVLLAIVAASVIASIIRGFTREIAGLVSLILGVLLGLWFHGTVGSIVQEFMPAAEVADMVGFGLIFLGVVALGSVVGSMASKVMQVTGLSLFDRLAGAAFGVLKGGLFGAIIVFAILAFSPGGPPRNVSESKVAPYVLWSARALAVVAPADIRAAVSRNAEIVQETWREAIPDGSIPAFPVEKAAPPGGAPKAVTPMSKSSRKPKPSPE